MGLTDARAATTYDDAVVTAVADGATLDGMKVDFQCVRATSNCGFMSFRRALSAGAAVLAVPA